MAQRHRSEIRGNQIRDLIQKVKDQKYGSYLRRIRLTKVRAFIGETGEYKACTWSFLQAAPKIENARHDRLRRVLLDEMSGIGNANERALPNAAGIRSRPGSCRVATRA
jgi:hypothetical protein